MVKYIFAFGLVLLMGTWLSLYISDECKSQVQYRLIITSKEWALPVGLQPMIGHQNLPPGICFYWYNGNQSYFQDSCNRYEVGDTKGKPRHLN